MMKGTVGVLSALWMLWALAQSSSALVDDFDDGDFDGWLPGRAAGDWTVENGELKYTGGSGLCGGGLYYADGVEWTDYEFQVDMRFTDPENYPGGIRVRLNPDTGEGYFTWAYPTDSLLISFVANEWDCNNNRGIAAQGAWVRPPVGEWGRFKMVVRGEVIESWWNDEKIISIEDDAWEKGTVGFSGFNKDVSFDNVRVSGPDIAAVDARGKLTVTCASIKNGSVL